MTLSKKNSEKPSLKIGEGNESPPNESAERDPYWTGPGYRHEYQCPHGIGHGNHIHGCDGCCQRKDYPLREENLAKTRAAEILRGVGPFRV